MRWAAVLLLIGASLSLVTPSRAEAVTPAIKHVWIITLENEEADTTFGPGSPAHFLNTTLRAEGTFVPNYYGTGHLSLDNYIAMVSGQGPNAVTQADCPLYVDVVPGTIGLDGQAYGQGCVYPATVKTIADQLEAKGLTWKGYMQDMGNDPTREAATCAHPALNSQDHTQAATAKDSYATRHNPFMYFHSIIDEPTCHTNVVALPPLLTDLAAEATTPNFSFITPSLCEDGHDAPCADGRPGGLVSADAFLSTWVPKIMASPAYRAGGMIVINFDEATVQGDASACCGEQPNPGGSPMPGIHGQGGGRTGAVVLTPFTKPATVTTQAYNHYSLLRSIEDLFGLTHLGFAGADGLVAFGADIYNAPVASPATTTTTVTPRPTKARGEVLPRTGGDAPVAGMTAVGVALVVVRVRRRVARRNAA